MRGENDSKQSDEIQANYVWLKIQRNCFSIAFSQIHLKPRFRATGNRKSQLCKASIFDEIPGVSSDDETLLNARYYFSKKMILEGEIEDAKMSSFSSDFQTLIKH